MKLSRHNAVSELDAAIDLRHTCGYVTMLRATAKRRPADSTRPSPTTSAADSAPLAADSALLARDSTPLAADSAHVYRGQSVGIDDVAADAVSTGSGSKDDPLDANFADLEKASLPDELNGVEQASPVNCCAGSVDTEVVEDQWVLLDCHFGVPLFDADVNRSVCRRIAKHGLCDQCR